MGETASGARPGDAARNEAVESVLCLDPHDHAPAYVQLERRVRIAVADGVLRPGDRLPSVRALADRLGVAPNTVGRAYADLAREGVIVGRPGRGTEVAPAGLLDQPALRRVRQDRLRLLARQVVVRGLALGLSADEIAGAVSEELALRGHPAPDGPPGGEARATSAAEGGGDRQDQ